MSSVPSWSSSEIGSSESEDGFMYLPTSHRDFKPLSSYRRRYNVIYWEIQDELRRNRRWFVARFELPERELIMQYLEDDVCTANAIVDLEIEIHHPNLNRARKANYFYRTPTVPPIKKVDVAVGPDE